MHENAYILYILLGVCALIQIVMRIELDLYDDKLKQAILDLPYNTKIDDNGVDCDMVFIPESDYGFAKIYRMYDDILMFLIPTYGGTPSLHKSYGRHAIDYMIKELREMC